LLRIKIKVQLNIKIRKRKTKYKETKPFNINDIIEKNNSNKNKSYNKRKYIFEGEVQPSKRQKLSNLKRTIESNCNIISKIIA